MGQTPSTVSNRDTLTVASEVPSTDNCTDDIGLYGAIESNRGHKAYPANYTLRVQPGASSVE